MILKPTRGILLSRTHPLARGLVGCWLFNEGSGGKVFDLSGNRNSGSLQGSTHFVPGKFGWVLDFDGSSDRVQIGDKTELEPAHLTLLIWVRTDNYADTFNGGVAKGWVFGAASMYSYKIDFHASNGRLYISDTSNNVHGGSISLTDNNWHMWTLTYDGTNVRGYKDASLGPTAASPNIDYTKSYNDFTIGAQASGSYSLDGQIAHVMVWNRALFASEIALLYREPFCMIDRAWRPGLIGGPIINFAGASAALSSLSATAKAIRKVGGTVASIGGLAAVGVSLSITEESSLDIERSWLREALFNGMTANAFKLGTTLSLGWFWVRVAGCSVLYRGPSMERIDFTNILTVAEQNACEISPPSYIPHNSSSTYFYVIRRFSNCGYQELTLAAAAKVSIDANGELEKPQPSNIFSSKAEQVDGNKIQLVWFYCPLEQKSQPVCFNVYYDGGMGQIDYENPLAKISYEGRRFYSYQSGALGAGEYLFTIRAEDADGVENSSSAQLKIQLDTTNPDAIDVLSTETV